MRMGMVQSVPGPEQGQAGCHGAATQRGAQPSGWARARGTSKPPLPSCPVPQPRWALPRPCVSPGPSRAILGHPGLSWAILGHPGPSRPIPGHPGPSRRCPSSAASRKGLGLVSLGGHKHEGLLPSPGGSQGMATPGWTGTRTEQPGWALGCASLGDRALGPCSTCQPPIDGFGPAAYKSSALEIM